MANVDIVRGAIAYLETPASGRRLGDYRQLFDRLHEDVSLEVVTPQGVSGMQGKRTVVDHITRLFSDTLAKPDLEEDTELEAPPEFFSNGGRVVALWKECKRNKITGVTSNSLEVAIVFELRDGSILRMLRFNR